MRVGLFTNNYLPFRGGVTTAVETLRQGLEADGHRVWVFAPAWRESRADPPFVFRYPSAPAPTYPGFAVPLPFSRRRLRARARRVPRPAPVPPRRHRAPSRARAEPAARVHVSHALREIRALRPASRAPGRGGGGAPGL